MLLVNSGRSLFFLLFSMGNSSIVGNLEEKFTFPLFSTAATTNFLPGFCSLTDFFRQGEKKFAGSVKIDDSVSLFSTIS